MVPRSRTPAPGFESTSRLPPTASSRSAMLVMPAPRFGGRRAEALTVVYDFEDRDAPSL